MQKCINMTSFTSILLYLLFPIFFNFIHFICLSFSLSLFFLYVVKFTCFTICIVYYVLFITFFSYFFSSTILLCHRLFYVRNRNILLYSCLLDTSVIKYLTHWAFFNSTNFSPLRIFAITMWNISCPLPHNKREL